MATTKKLDVRKVAPVIGMEVTDKISGYTGFVRGVQIHNSGCVNALIQKGGLNIDGTPYKHLWLELSGMENFKKLPKCERPEILGKQVRDTLTDYEGTCTAITILDYFDARVHIQGKSRTEEGIPSPEHICDLEVVERTDEKPVPKTKQTGAPSFLSTAINLSAR
jgi:hypothetical protein